MQNIIVMKNRKIVPLAMRKGVGDVSSSANIFFVPDICDSIIVQRLHVFFRSIRRTVIENNQFKIPACLVQYTIDRLFQVLNPVIRNDKRCDSGF